MCKSAANCIFFFFPPPQVKLYVNLLVGILIFMKYGLAFHFSCLGLA